MVLATSFKDMVTARTMSHVNDGLTIMFQTSRHSKKAEQIKENANIALVIGNIQMEAVGTLHGHPMENSLFIEKYKAKFPQYYNQYTHSIDEILVIAQPSKISLYKYIDEKPCSIELYVKQGLLKTIEI